ncbi:unnamed protein product [Soboliphyme baturini]|uniref:E3 ubiquitin-protein ligase MARCHF5 n=1 Tax=Soboliphyme baturini TaxID=241478 RepID=A0A183J9C3_9BILA|nr:unnamed protein product [Soboliphyme baturini]
MASWVKPCRCRGSTKWVHQRCLQRWIDVKQNGDLTASVECHQCRTPYRIKYPPMNFLMRLLNSIDQSVSRFCPFLSGIIVFGSAYWSAVTYGALIVMQIVGRRRGLSLIRRSDPWLLLLALPGIPLSLIACHMVQWEDRVTNFIANLLLEVRRSFGDLSNAILCFVLLVET